MSEIKVFISYSHDSDAHRERVLELSQRLRRDGIETFLDRYQQRGSPPEGWPRWMLNGLNAATHVLCVCTETYHRRFLGQEVQGQGRGVDWEGALMSNALYEARSRTNKFVPLVFSRVDEPHIPLPLRGQTHYVLDTHAGYEALFDALLGQAGVEPEAVGSLKRMPRRSAQPELAGAAVPLQAAAAPERRALAVWAEKLDFLLIEEALCVDPEMKFRLKHLIAEAHGKIRSFGRGD